MAIYVLFRRALDRVLAEPAVALGVVIAAVSSVTEPSWQAYAAAVAVALLRFAVSPVPKLDRRDTRKLRRG